MCPCFDVTAQLFEMEKDQIFIRYIHQDICLKQENGDDIDRNAVCGRCMSILLRLFCYIWWQRDKSYIMWSYDRQVEKCIQLLVQTVI